MSDKPKRELLPGEAEVDAWIDTLERRADAMSGIALILLLAILMWGGVLYVVSLGNMMHWWYL